MTFNPSDTIQITNPGNLFYLRQGLVTDRIRIKGETYYRVNLTIPGCQLAQGVDIQTMSLMIPVVVREFEMELV